MVLVLFVLLVPSATWATEPVKIGMVTTLSTKAGYLGEEVRDGFKLAIAQEGGQLGGVPVELLVCLLETLMSLRTKRREIKTASL